MSPSHIGEVTWLTWLFSSVLDRSPAEKGELQESGGPSLA